MIVLETPSLILREMTMDDVAAVVAYCAEPSVRRYMYWSQGQPAAIARAARHVSREATNAVRTEYIFVLRLRSSSAVIGRCFLQGVAGKASPTIGWDLDRLFWGQGLATEAAKAVVDFAFTECKIASIEAYCDRANRASVRVMEKVGMMRQGTWFDELILGFVYRRFQPVVHYQITRAQWQQTHAP